MNDYVIGHIRQFVPSAVAAVAVWAATEFGFVLDDTTSTAVAIAATGILTAAYYAAVRAIAEKIPAAGALLGVNKAPAYKA